VRIQSVDRVAAFDSQFRVIGVEVRASSRFDGGAWRRIAGQRPEKWTTIGLFGSKNDILEVLDFASFAKVNTVSSEFVECRFIKKPKLIQ
jgi:hypothetical protein